MTQNPYLRMVELARKATVPVEFCDVTPATDRDELAKVVAANRPILEEIRECFTPECCVPLRYEKDYYSQEHMPQIQDLRNVARAFQMAGSLGQIDRQWIESVQAGIDLLWLGCVTRRGGLNVDMLVAAAITGTGFDVLRKVRTKLDQTQRSQLLAVLPQVEAAIEPLEVITTRDRDWELAVEYEDEPLDTDKWLEQLTSDESLDDEERQAIQILVEEYQKGHRIVPGDIKPMLLDADQRRVAQFRMLTIDLALRTYHRATGEYPVELSKLAPAVLPHVPLDPFTGKPFLYHWMPHDFQLSSPGPSGVDSKVLGPWPMVSQGQANLCLDEGDFYEE